MNRTAIVMGNGESLNDMPKELLEQCGASFGMNYALYQPTHYVCVDTKVITHHASDILHYVQNAKVAYLNHAHATDAPELYSLPNVRRVYKDTDAFRDEIVLSGFTSSYVALKMAFYEGFRKVLVWGVDMDWEWKHYSPDYPPQHYRSEVRWEAMKLHLNYANRVYKENGRQILNFSKPSDLEFERG